MVNLYPVTQMKKQIPPSVHNWPAPAVLVGCGTTSQPNIITISWFGTVNSVPPMVSVSIRPSRHSFKLIQRSGEFTVNIPRLSDIKSVILAGEKSGRDTDKFRELKLTALSCPPLLTAPMIAESFLSLGCKLKKELPLGTHHIFIGEIVCAYCEEEFIRPDGSVNPSPESQFVWLDKSYWRLKPIE